MYVAVGNHRVAGFLQRCGPALGLPAGRWHSIGQGTADHEHEVDYRHHHETLPDAYAFRAGKVVHQRCSQWRAHHGATAKAHDRHTGGHAALVREPLDQGRNRRDIAQTQADTADDTRAQPHQPELVGIDTERRDQQATTPAQRRNHPGLARPGVLQPATPNGCRAAEEHEEQGIDPAEHRDLPVAFSAEQAGEEAHVRRTGNRRGDTDRLRQRQPEHRKAVGHANAQMDGQRRRWYQPAVETRRGDDPLLGQKTRAAG
ncbi:hypothetical protein D9M71_550400 [compost metagenome]